MPALSNPRLEYFVSLVAGGATPTKAYLLAGYAKAGAASAAAKRLQKAPIKARLDELRAAVEQRTIQGSAVTRTWVLGKLQYAVELGLKLNDDGKPAETFNLAAANQSLRMLGLEVGMFKESVDHTVWNGDLTTLSEAQLATLIARLEQRLASESAEPGPVVKTIEASGEVINVETADRL